MPIFYRIIIILLILMAGYSIVGISHFKWLYHRVENPKASFQISGNENAKTILVEFINYGCGYCKEIHPVIEEALSVRKDIGYIARPIVFGAEETKDIDRLTKLAFAAGLQDKFWEFHKAFLEYPKQDIPDSFIEETASLYGVDYEKMLSDSEGKKVEKLVKDNFNVLNHAGLVSVPSFMIGGKIYMISDENLPDLSQILDMVKNAEKS